MGMACMVAPERVFRSGEKAGSGAANRRRNDESGAHGAARAPPGALLSSRPQPGGYSRWFARPRPSDHSSALDCWVSYSASTYCTRML